MKNSDLKKEIAKWVLYGIAASIVAYILSYVSYILFRDPSEYIFILLILLSPFIIKKEKKDILEDYFIFKCNPEIALLIFCAGMSYENEAWDLFHDILYGWTSVRMLIASSIRYLFGLFIFWYLAIVIDRVIRIDKIDFLNRSFIYSFIVFLRKKRYEKLFKKKNHINTLYEVVSEMAKGNLDVEIPENLGPYEPFREELEKMRSGTKAIVNRELKSERMKLELVENVSHDLKTPLTAIITYIDLLKEEKDEEKRKEYIDIVSKRADRLKILIEDLFEVTKASTGNVKFEPIEVDIVNLVKQVEVEYQERFKERNLEIELDIPNKKIPVYVDPQKTYRIYANLLGNVAKYSLKNSRVYIKIDETENEAVVVIKNISQAKLSMNGAELTERFVRGDVSRNTEGSGLGLAIAKNFTTLQGGSFDIIIDGDLFKSLTIWKKA